MQEKRRLELQAQMDAALARNDAAEVESLRRTIDRETLECTAHTAERLKRVEEDVRIIKEAVTAGKHRAEGMKFLLEVLRLVACSGGGAVVLRILQSWNP